MSIVNLEKVPSIFRNLGTLKYIRQGSLSEVYQIVGCQQNYALKIILCNKNQRKYEIIKKEIEIMQTLSQCEHIMKMVGMEEIEDDDGRRVYILEEFVTPLSKHLKTVVLTVAEVLKIIAEVATAMMECEQKGIAHLDITPDNIFISKEGNVLLGDFSSSLFLSELADNRLVRGTLAYMAPEVYRNGECSIQSDIYSIGMVLYYMLNGLKGPFMGEYDNETGIYKRLAGTEFPELQGINDTLKEGVEKIIQKACAFDRDKRYERIRDFKDEVEALECKLREKVWEDCFINNVEEQSKADATSSNVTEIIWDAEPFATSAILWEETRNKYKNQTMLLWTEYDEVEALKCKPREKAWKDCFINNGEEQSETDAISSNVSEIIWDAEPFATSIALWEETGNEYKNQTMRLWTEDDEFGKGGFLKGKKPEKRSCSFCGSEVGNSNFCPNCGARVIKEEPVLKISKVEFSAVAPQAVRKGEYALIDVIMYEEQFRRIVDDLLSADKTTIEEKVGMVSVYEHSMIKMVISSPYFDIENSIEKREWNGQYLKFSFSVFIPADIHIKEIIFFIDVYINDIVSTKLRFKTKIQEDAKQEMTVARQDINSIFISYAKQDKKRVWNVIQGIYSARPEVDIFWRLDEIRKGRAYEYKVKKEIDYRDAFFLCWSGFAEKSHNVDFEWKYAYDKKGVEGIFPILLEPVAKDTLPDELKTQQLDNQLFDSIEDDEEERKLYISKNAFIYKNIQDCAVYLGGKRIEMEYLQYRILRCLAENKGRFVEYEALAKYAWEDRYYEGSLNLKNAVSKVRNLIKDECKINNKYGVGYMISKVNEDVSLSKSII